MYKIIQKAIEGGYMQGFIFNSIAGTGEIFFESKNVLKQGTYRSKEKIVLDPLFWQALGKACGWGSTNLYKATLYGKPSREIMEWEMNALHFYELNLIEGWDAAVEYITSLVTTKE